MADIDCRLIPYNPVEIGINLRLRYGVKGRRGLVKNDKGGVSVQRSGKGDLLGFPSGDLHPVGIKVFIDGGFQSIGQLLIPVPEAHLPQKSFGLLPVPVCGAGHLAQEAWPEGCNLETPRKKYPDIAYNHIFGY